MEANSIMNIRPLYDRIVVKRIEEQETTLGDLSALMQGGVVDAAKQPGAASAPLSAVAAPALDGLRESLQNHLRRARELAAQGKWAEAGKELDAIEVESPK
jgi:hypothetical protein